MGLVLIRSCRSIVQTKTEQGPLERSPSRTADQIKGWRWWVLLPQAPRASASVDGFKHASFARKSFKMTSWLVPRRRCEISTAPEFMASWCHQQRFVHKGMPLQCRIDSYVQRTSPRGVFALLECIASDLSKARAQLELLTEPCA